MGFGYEILHGRRGVSGLLREEAGKKIVCVQGVKPGETCALYAMGEGEPVLFDERAADAGGQAALTGRGEAPFFVASGGKVRLWQGGEDVYLRASEWVRKKTQPAPNTPNDAKNILKQDLEEIQQAPLREEIRQEADDPKEEAIPPLAYAVALEPMEQEEPAVPEPEPAYTLRPAGTGEPVDALPG